MNTPTHESFLGAIKNKTKIRVSFLSDEDSRVIARLCAPMDYGISRRAADTRPRYHLWDYESDSKPHPIALEAKNIRELVYLEDHFDPAEFIKWDTKKSPWHVARDWGQFS
jgi:hypothetical protein